MDRYGNQDHALTADQFVILRDGESKRYDFETKSADEANEIVTAIKQGMSLNQ